MYSRYSLYEKIIEFFNFWLRYIIKGGNMYKKKINIKECCMKGNCGNGNCSCNHLTKRRLGLGTIWIGRRWPLDDVDYKYPVNNEVEEFLLKAYQSGIRMFDTATAYGFAEQKLGDFFKKHPEFIKESFIATKWGVDFDIKTEDNPIDHTLPFLKKSFKQSQELLPKVDLLYIHRVENIDVLKSKEIRVEMEKLKKEGKIRFTGASIPSPKVIEEALEKDLLWFDYLQTGSWNVHDNSALLSKVAAKGIKIVINAPARVKPDKLSVKDSFALIGKKPYVSFVLTGTRNHLDDNIRYARENSLLDN